MENTELQQKTTNKSTKFDARKFGVRCLKAACITAIAFVLSTVLMQPFSFSAATLISSNEGSDFNITDFYNIVADSRAVRAVDSVITIIDINGATREDVADVLAVLPDLGPRVVGLDVMFDKPHDDDTFLLDAIAANPELVMLVDVDPDKARNASTFHISDTSFFHSKILSHPLGTSNLPTRRAGGVVRDFRPYYPLNSGDSIPAFAIAVAEKADPVAVARLRHRADDSELINFPSRRFRTVPWPEIFDNEEYIRNHVVLLGDMDNAADFHATPADRKMPGILVHAHILSTVLNGNYINEIPEAWNYIIAIVLCFLLALLHLYTPASFKAMALRFVQLLALYVVIVIGYHYFIEYSTVINFSYTLLMLTFVLFTCDLWLGTPAFIKWCTERWHALMKRLNSKKNNPNTHLRNA